jgi:MoaA/NifB/PqqE/SkfB family radical SAM enzyme
MKSFACFPKCVLSTARSVFAKSRATNCVWELTYQCNAQCSFCSYWNNAPSPYQELTLDEIQRGVDSVYRTGCRIINFSGGEPTLRQDLEEIIQYASAKGMWISMVSNGSVLTPERIDRLKNAGLDNLFLSLDYADPHRHDSIRKIDGLHDRVLEGLSYLSKHFISAHRTAGVMCVISKQNVHEVERLIALTQQLDVYITFQLHHGRKTGNTDDEPNNIPNLVDNLLRQQKSHRHVIASRKFIQGMRHFGMKQFPACRAGEKYFSIDPYGYVHPCVDMPSVGHILDHGLAALRAPASISGVKNCSGCWYCFRGEADVSFSVSGCLEKIARHVRIVLANQTRWA